MVTEDGDPLDYRPAAIRTLLRIVDVFPALYLVGILSILLASRKQRIGDIVANTVVVRANAA